MKTARSARFVAVQSALEKHDRPGGISCKDLVELSNIELGQMPGCGGISVSRGYPNYVVSVLERVGRVEIKGRAGRGRLAGVLWGLVATPSEEVQKVDATLAAYSFELRDPWDGPGYYGFDLVGPEWRAAFGEVVVGADATVTLLDVPIDSTDPPSTFPDEVVVGLLEVLVPSEPLLHAFLETYGEAGLRRAFVRHVGPLGDSLIASVRARMYPEVADKHARGEGCTADSIVD